MDQIKKIVLVPYDYSELSEHAVKHGIQYATVTEAQLVLLHIIPDLSTEAEALHKLQAAAEVFSAKYGIKIECKIRPGRVSTAIHTVAENLNASLVVMKTQKPIGKEKITGTRAIRLMSGSRIPFIVVQAPPKRIGLRKIVFPIDFRKENKEKLSWISFLSKFYTSKIFLFKPNVSDYVVRNNLDFSRRFLEGKSIDYEIITGKSKYTLAKDTLEFAHQIDSELIIILLSKHINWFNLMVGLEDQRFISNDYKIPIMCINPRSDLKKFEGFY